MTFDQYMICLLILLVAVFMWLVLDQTPEKKEAPKATTPEQAKLAVDKTIEKDNLRRLKRKVNRTGAPDSPGKRSGPPKGARVSSTPPSATNRGAKT